MVRAATIKWVQAATLAGIVYIAVGAAFSVLSSSSTSEETKELWQRSAWLTSGIVFVVNILYKHWRLKNSPPFAALHVCLAAALGAFGLAVVANVRAVIASTPGRSLLGLSLVLWPLVTAVPAFVVALIMAVILNTLKRKSRGE